MVKFSKYNAIGLIIFISLVYLFTLRGIAGNLLPSQYGTGKLKVNRPPFETSMERGRYAQIVAFSKTKDFYVDEFHNFLSPDIAWYNGHYYSTFPVGTSLIAFPLYFIGSIFHLSQVFSFSVSALFSILTAYLIFKISKYLGLSYQAAFFSSICYSLASVAWAYSVTLSAHPISAFIVTWGFLVFLEISESKSNYRNFMILWLLFGLCLFIDYVDLIIFIPILFASILKVLYLANKNVESEIKIPIAPFIGSVGFVCIFVLFIIFNLTHYNRPIAFTNSYSIKYIGNSNLSNEVLDNIKYENRFSFSRIVSGAQVLLFSKDRGILFFSPVFLLSIVGFFILKKEKKLVTLVLFYSFLLNVVIYAMYDDPWGGWSFGSRYLIATIPLLSLLCGVAFDYLNNKFGIKSKIVIYTLLFYSVGIAGLGAFTTNAVPPSVEVIHTNIPDNFVSNWRYLQNNGTSSFLYSLFFHNLVNPKQYFFIILFIIGLLLAFIIFSEKSSMSMGKTRRIKV